MNGIMLQDLKDLLARRSEGLLNLGLLSAKIQRTTRRADRSNGGARGAKFRRRSDVVSGDSSFLVDVGPGYKVYKK